MRLSPSTRLGPYEIVAALGAGGMGEVYRARDTRLGREVAIKVLPEHLVAQPDVRTRFEREARTISSLNHPHICTLHDVGREGDVDYLVMELVEGETLAERLSRGPLPQAELLRLATQIADALDRAHRAGIVHRDFKPGNVMVTKAGAKLMDFGLARASIASGGAPGTSSTGVTVAQLSQSPTVMSPLTGQGSLLGTFLYMAPEQLEGREADARSDIWAFGCVLYEMATERRAFEGKSQASLIGAIMNSEPPPIANSNSAIAPGLDALVRACLAKDPEERIQTAHDIKLQLGWLGQPASQSGVAAPVALPPRSRGREPIAWGVAALAGVAAGVLAWLGPLKPAPERPQIRFEIPLPAEVVDVDMPIISPDGRTLAYTAQDSTARQRIWIRPLNSLAANPLPGTENANRPFWSPDSRYLAFMADGKLKKIAIAGGPVEVVANAPSGADGTWGRNGDILYDGTANDPIMRVASSGGVPDTALAADSTTQVGWPAFLPDGKHYFYTVLRGGETEVMLGTLGSSTGRPLGITGSRVSYSPDGYLMFARDRALLAQRFDPGSRKLVGEPFPVAENLPVGNNAQANFTVSSNGVLVYRATGELRSRLVWLDRNGRELAEVAGPADYRAPALSPDGRRVIIRRRDGEGANLDLWMLDLARGTTTRFTFDPGQDGNPIWSPDGARIVWNAARGGQDGLYEKSASGVGEERLVVGSATAATSTSWSPDGRHVLFSAAVAGGVPDLYVVALEGDRTPRAIANSPFAEIRGAFSPDGRWIAYQSNESGRAEIYVIPFTGPAGRWQVSTRGGTDPAWSPDGRELYYLADDSRFMSVPITPGEVFSPGTPQQLFIVRVEGGFRRNVYCVAPDNQRFLFQVPVGETSTPMTAVVNWRAGVGKR
jgi:eukaryotic-like serine/threonine-protein kinase